MPEIVNTSALACTGFDDKNDGRDVMVDVDHVTMIFNMASEQLNNLKEYAIALARKELRFKEFRALDDVSFQVKRGDVFGILGTNGSGKSTILKIIAGVLEPSKGKCSVNGNIAPLIELGAGFDMELTARENIFLNGALLGYSKAFIEEHFDEIVEFAEVEKFLDMPMKNYSSGMVARIAFAIATVIVPEILIVDEVLSVGDFMFQRKCEDRINKLIKEHGVTVLIVSHSNDQIERLCNKAVWIEKGHLRMAGSAKEVCGVYRVLGGRVGDGESEKMVFEALANKNAIVPGTVESLTAETRYGLSAKTAQRCYPNGCDTVVLTPGDRLEDSLAVCGLAGALEAPLLLVQDGNIPDVIAQAMLKLNPSRVVFAGIEIEGLELFPDLLSEIFEQKSVEFESIAAADYPSLSTKLFEYGRKRSIWGRDAVLSFDSCTGDLVSLSPYTASKRCPIFLDHYEGSPMDSFSEILLTGGFERVLVLGGPERFSKVFVDVLAERGIEAVRFCGRDHYDANGIINDWIDSQIGDDDDIRDLIVAPIWNPEDSCTAFSLAVKLKSRIIFDDPQDLDSIAHGLRYLQRKKSVKKLIFVGDKTRYNDVDKAILAYGLSS